MRPRRLEANVIQATPPAKTNTMAYCALSQIKRLALPSRERTSVMASSGRRSQPLTCKPITIPPTIRPIISAVRTDRFISGLLSILFRRCKRIVRPDHEVAQELIRRIDRRAVEDEIFLASVFLNQAEPKLVVLEKMRAKIRHRHAFRLRPLNQARARGFVEGNFGAVFFSEFFREDERALLQRGFFLLVPFGHETVEHALGLPDQFRRDAQLAETRAGQVIFVIAKEFFPDGEQAPRAGFFQRRRLGHQAQCFILETDLDSIGPKGPLVLP